MKLQKLMLLSLAAASLMLVPLVVPFSDNHNHQVLAEKGQTQSENKPLSNESNNVKVEFEAPDTVYVNDLVPVKMKVTDQNSGAPLTHVDWAIVVKDPNGNIIYKTTTAHSHVGMMDINVTFPTAGLSTVSLTISSIGPKMMGMDVPGMARTHIMVSGDPMNGWKTDQDNDFGTRTYEFPLAVLSEKQVKTISGSEKGTSLNVEMATNADQIVAGKPITLVFTVTNGKDGSMVTHPDMQVKVRTGSYITSESAPGGDMMAMNGAYHGHTGVMTLTTTFPRAGHYLIDTDLASLPVSNLIFGKANTRFALDVAEPSESARVHSAETSSPAPNTINIVGIESPFFVPNSIDVKAGTTLTFANTDGNIHTVTSVKAGTTEPDGRFDSGMVKGGDSFAVKLDKPGTYNYICTIHPGMKGTVKVS
jgi:plastocyanin